MNKFLFVFIIITWLGCGTNQQNTGFEDNNTNETQPKAQSKMITSDTLKIEASGATMSEMRFNKKVIRVPSNKILTIGLINRSTDATMPHNLVIIEPETANSVGQNGLKYKKNAYVNPKDKNVIAHSPLAQIGETVYFTFKTPAPGNYEFICSYPGHWGLMKGKFIIE